MKKLFFMAAAGLALGSTLSSLSAGCGCPPFQDLQRGMYKAAPGQQVESDYSLEIKGADPTIVERFTRNGKSYVLTY